MIADVSGWLGQIDALVLRFLDSPRNLVFAILVALAALFLARSARSAWFYAKLMAKSLLRNWLRTGLTAFATMVLVLVITLVWTVLGFLDQVTSDKSRDIKVAVSEKWQVPSLLPLPYEAMLGNGNPPPNGGGYTVADLDSISWQFYGGTIDPKNRTRENQIFFFCLPPRKLMVVERDADGQPVHGPTGKLKFSSMMDNLDDLTDQQLLDLDLGSRALEQDHRRCLVGEERLRMLNKRVGETIKVTSMNFKDIDLEVEIVGSLPRGRYDQIAIMNRDYLNNAIDDYNKKNKDKHPMSERRLNLILLRVPDSAAFQQVEHQVSSAPLTSPAVKCETMSSGAATFLDSYRDLIWGMRWVLVPFILLTMALIIAAAISISVRERRKEMAVLKVLGFAPGQILLLVLGEALLVGCLSGLVAAGGVYVYVTMYLGGLRLPMGFFPPFRIPFDAVWWGLAVGGGTALLGSLLPSLSASSTRVAEVFSRTA